MYSTFINSTGLLRNSPEDSDIGISSSSTANQCTTGLHLNQNLKKMEKQYTTFQTTRYILTGNVRSASVDECYCIAVLLPSNETTMLVIFSLLLL